MRSRPIAFIVEESVKRDKSATASSAKSSRSSYKELISAQLKIPKKDIKAFVSDSDLSSVLSEGLDMNDNEFARINNVEEEEGSAHSSDTLGE